MDVREAEEDPKSVAGGDRYPGSTGRLTRKIGDTPPLGGKPVGKDTPIQCSVGRSNKPTTLDGGFFADINYPFQIAHGPLCQTLCHPFLDR